jgi:hypothetical protein
MTSKDKGDIAVSQAIAYYSLKGIPILLPFGDKNKYDLVIEDQDGFKKVQCKYSNVIKKSGGYEIPMRVCGGNQSRFNAISYKNGDFDILFVTTGNGDNYAIPWVTIGMCSTSIVVGKKYLEYKIDSIRT